MHACAAYEAGDVSMFCCRTQGYVVVLLDGQCLRNACQQQLSREWDALVKGSRHIRAKGRARSPGAWLRVQAGSQSLWTSLRLVLDRLALLIRESAVHAAVAAAVAANGRLLQLFVLNVLFCNQICSVRWR